MSRRSTKQRRAARRRRKGNFAGIFRTVQVNWRSVLNTPPLVELLRELENGWARSGWYWSSP
jgi:hypothetical protein